MSQVFFLHFVLLMLLVYCSLYRRNTRHLALLEVETGGVARASINDIVEHAVFHEYVAEHLRCQHIQNIIVLCRHFSVIVAFPRFLTQLTLPCHVQGFHVLHYFFTHFGLLKIARSVFIFG